MVTGSKSSWNMWVLNLIALERLSYKSIIYLFNKCRRWVKPTIVVLQYNIILIKLSSFKRGPHLKGKKAQRIMVARPTRCTWAWFNHWPRPQITNCFALGPEASRARFNSRGGGGVGRVMIAGPFLHPPLCLPYYDRNAVCMKRYLNVIYSLYSKKDVTQVFLFFNFFVFITVLS